MNAEVIYPLAGKRVYVAGHRGMVGGALVRRLAGVGCEILTASRAELDLEDQAATRAWFARIRPQAVFVAAAKVGGIAANSALPVDFLERNLRTALNTISAAHEYGAEKLMFLGSSCIYPRQAPQPMPEEALLTGPLEPTNEWYAIAKIAGIKLVQAYRRQYGDDFIAAMPTNLYGAGDNYHPEHAHVPAALIRRFHEAKLAGDAKAIVWGTGKPLREFLHVDDLADACVFLMERYSGEQFINVGAGREIEIGAFAGLVAEAVGYRGALEFDPSRPDGMPRKLLDSSRLTAMGWAPHIALRDGLASAYRDFLTGQWREA